jgi:hypothetical protein
VKLGDFGLAKEDFLQKVGEIVFSYIPVWRILYVFILTDNSFGIPEKDVGKGFLSLFLKPVTESDIQYVTKLE